MKSDAVEFTGVQPFEDHPNMAPSFQLGMDLLDSSEMFDVSLLDPDEVVHIHTPEGDFSFVLELPGDGRSIPRGSARKVRILGSTLECLEEGESVRLDGAATPGSLAQVGFLGRYSPICFSKVTEIPFDEEDIELLNKLTQEKRDAFLALDNVHESEGGYSITMWDGVWRRTGEVLRAERQKTDEDPPISIF